MSELQQFVAELLEERGAAVEPVEPEGLDVLAPPDVRETLGLPEIARLGFAAELPPGARRVGLEPDWLDRLGRLLGERGRSSRLVIEQDLPALSCPSGWSSMPCSFKTPRGGWWACGRPGRATCC